MGQKNVQKKVTVLEIARKAKVSRAAAYAAINSTKGSTIGISQEKRKRVLEVAREMGYVRNELARSLVTGKTYTIGVLVHSLKNHFFTDFFTCLDDACYQAGYSASFASSEFDPNREARHLQAFLAKKVDAMVIVRDPVHRNDTILRQFPNHGIPIITVGELYSDRLMYPNVCFNGTLGDSLAADYLWAQGHRKVLFFSTNKEGDGASIIHRLRRDNFASAWSEHPKAPALEYFETNDPIHGGNELGEYLSSCSLRKRATAVMCGCDRLAISLMSALRVHNIEVPKDISVMGYDDIDSAAEQAVPLTTIRLSTQKLAAGVWSLLQKTLQDTSESKSPDSPECLVIKPELIVRNSVRACCEKKSKSDF